MIHARRRGGIPDQRGKTLRQKADDLATYLSDAASRGFLEESLTHIKLMYHNVRVADDMECVWYSGFRLEWMRQARPPRYHVYNIEHSGANAVRLRKLAS